jgi:hydroxymethylpyrimidine pyrophosphatase-like HAD family hydrolase
MRYLVLVTDYDGTIATEGQAETAALQAIERLRMSGRRIILLTGRRIDDLLAACQVCVCSITLWQRMGR